MLLEILKDIPQNGRMVKLGANCPLCLIMVGTRPDINAISIQDGDREWIHERSSVTAVGTDVSRVDWRDGRNGLDEAKAHQGNIDMLFLYSHLPTQELHDRLDAWLPMMARPSWLVVQDWARKPTVKQAVYGVIDRWPDRTSPWSAAWRFQ
jgi:hypothetical protein